MIKKKFEHKLVRGKKYCKIEGDQRKYWKIKGLLVENTIVNGLLQGMIGNSRLIRKYLGSGGLD